MNRAEAEILLGSVDSFTNNVLRRKMLDEQRAERAQREILQREAMGRQDYQFGEQMKRDDAKMAADTAYRKDEQAARAADRAADASFREKSLANQASIQQIQEQIRKDANATRQLDQVNSAYANIERGVREGSISPEEGNRQVKAMYEQMKGTFDAMISLTPLAVFSTEADGDVQVFRAPPTKPDKPAPEPVVEERTETKEGDLPGVKTSTTRKLTRSDIEAEGKQKAIGAAQLKRQIGVRRGDANMVREAEAELQRLGVGQTATPQAKSRFGVTVVK
jgi:hypothetical protein